MNSNATDTNEKKGAIPVSDAHFQEEVLGYPQPVLVDFWAPWCGPCRMVAPVVDELASLYAGKIKVVKVDVDQSPETAAKYGITSIPTLMTFKQGEIIDRVVGAASRRVLTAKLDALLQ